MKRKFKSLLAIALSVAVMVTFVPMMTVTASAAAKAKSVEITNTEQVVAVGGTLALKATVTPSKASKQVKWKSSNTKVATVSSKGVVKGKKSGKVKITATSKAGNKKDSCWLYICPVDDAQVDTLNSSRSVDGWDTLYEVNYTADYKSDVIFGDDFQRLLQSGTVSRNDAILKELVPNTTNLKTASDIDDRKLGGCTSFAYQLDNGHQVLGRNYDWSVGEPIAEVIHTSPEDGYKSVGMADLSWAKVFKEAGYADMDDDGVKETEVFAYDTEKCRELTLLAPYYTVDGVNEKGFSASVLILDENSTCQGTVSSDNILIESHVVRAMLDKCATVDDAVEFLKSKNIQVPIAYYSEDGGGSDFHWCVTDESGDSAILEYVDGKLHVNKVTGVYDADGSKITDNVLNVKGVFNVEGMNDYYYSEAALTPRTFPAVKANKKGETTSREKQDFVATTNFYVSAFKDNDGKVQEGATTFAGEGVARYKEVYKELSSGEVGTNKEAMNLLKNCKYGWSDGDYYKSCEFLYDQFSEGGEYAELYESWAAYYESIGEMQTAEYYRGLIEYYHEMYNGNLDNDAWGWITYWSNVYDTKTKTMNMCYNENYYTTYRFGINY